MAGKRGNNEGSIYKDKNRNRWIGQVSVNSSSGKKRISVYGATRSEVRDKIAKLLNTPSNIQMIDNAKITLQAWIIVWLEDYKKLSLKRSSIDNYYRYFNTHIKDTPLGMTQLNKVNTNQIQRFINEKSQNGRADGTGGLRKSSVKHIFNVIYGAMDQAQRCGMLATPNICKSVILPRNDKKEMLYFTPEQANLFLESIRRSKYYPLYTLVLVTGLRLGEVIALRWDCVDLEEGKIAVKLNAAIVSKEVQTDKGVVHSEVVLQTPKTKKSMRTLYIEEPIITMLENLRKEQLKACMECGDTYENSGFVFTNDYGKMMHPRSIQDHFKRAIKNAGLPNLHFHCLRHTAATLMLYNGVDIRTVQEVLGHEDMQTTANVYLHIMEDMKKDAQKTIYNSITLHEHAVYMIKHA
jgi:integrase